MPRNATNLADDPEISIRLKYGIHTIFLFAMRDWPFSHLTAELLSILQDRYPKGLTPSIAEVGGTPVPATGSEVKIVYAVPRNPRDLSQGWKSLKAHDTDTIGSKGLTDTCAVAFAFLDGDMDETDAVFHVEVPTLEDEDV